MIGLATPASAQSTGIVGTITNAETGAPVGGAWVEAYDSSGYSTGGVNAEEDGTYDLYWLEPGEAYRLHVYAYDHIAQWAFGKDSLGTADPVTAPGTASIALAPVKYGTVVGGFKTSAGAPIANATVELHEGYQNFRRSAVTDAAGAFRMTRVVPGTYTLKFIQPSGLSQWAYGQVNFADASQITVGDGETAVWETALPTGNLDITVTDAKTSAPLAGACVSTRGGPQFVFACTGADGRAAFRTISVGTYSFSISPPAGYLYGGVDDVVVRADATTSAATTLTPEAKLEFTMRDAATAAPVAGACVVLVNEEGRGVVHDHTNCADSQGVVRVGGYPAGRFRAFVKTTDGVHGAQWVGAHGGTGNVDKATWIEAVAGATASVPVRLDGAGAISGTVTAQADGRPVSDICATVTPAAAWRTQWFTPACTYTEGRYTISGLGPYDWRVQFPDYSGKYAWTWSGGAADRLEAAEIAVRVGETATVDAALPAAGRVTGKLIGATRPAPYITVLAVDPRTGDYASPNGFARADGTYEVSGIGTRKVKLLYIASMSGTPAYSDTIKVNAGQTVTVDLPVPQ
ncbi:carboxypeptidase regulatory-like domain-containing protein [Actinokineospora sp. HUAS TT18]|uniref:carboxypeptidase regulatory-like domain-containing protein n=1 Tax=Actinokineospora sp. HUAS TT18 TaxID=3447451 RepID=UPI003F51D5C9